MALQMASLSDVPFRRFLIISFDVWSYCSINWFVIDTIEIIKGLTEYIIIHIYKLLLTVAMN